MGKLKKAWGKAYVGARKTYKKVHKVWKKSKPMRKSMVRHGERIERNMAEYLKPTKAMRDFPSVSDLLR